MVNIFTIKLAREGSSELVEQWGLANVRLTPTPMMFAQAKLT